MDSILHNKKALNPRFYINRILLALNHLKSFPIIIHSHIYHTMKIHKAHRNQYSLKVHWTLYIYILCDGAFFFKIVNLKWTSSMES